MELPQIAFREVGYTITNFVDISNTVLQYIKHFAHLAEVRDLPVPVYKSYYLDNQPIFQYLFVKEILPYPIPVSRVAINKLLQVDRPDKFNIY